jgi:FkbM family methyltransferase
MKRAGWFWVPDHETVQVEQLSRHGGWQLDHLDAALQFVPEKKRRIAIDGGAHVGSWTFHMLRRGFNTVRAFEPSRETFECLRENVKEWQIEHMADVQPQFIGLHGCALGAEAGKMGMKDDTKYAGGNTGGRHLKGDGDVDVRPLDVYRWDDVDFIKLDLEGFEPFAIRGMMGTITRCRPVILFEDKHRMAFRYGYQPGEASRLLESMGMVQVGEVGSDRIFGWPT